MIVGRKLRKERSAQFRAKISQLLSQKVYSLRQSGEEEAKVVLNLITFATFRMKGNPQNAHLYRTVLRNVVKDLQKGGGHEGAAI